MRHNKTKRVLTYWMDLFDNTAPDLSGFDSIETHATAEPIRRWPDRAAIQPAACRDLLSDLFILDASGSQPVYRLAGTSICALYGRELRRETFEEAFSGMDRRAVRSWVSRLGVDDYLVLICSRGETEAGDTVSLETLLMPLEHKGERDQRMLGLTVPCTQPHWLGVTPVVSQTVRSIRVIRPWENDAFKANWPFEVPAAARSTNRRSLDTAALGYDTALVDTNRPALPAEQAAAARQVAHLKVIEGGRSR
ncbi:MAG: PAS domain-containing protein [Pseudomonadota bacterium]